MGSGKASFAVEETETDDSLMGVNFTVSVRGIGGNRALTSTAEL